MSDFYKSLAFLLVMVLVTNADGSTLFDDSSVLELSLEGPISELIASDSDTHEQSFKLSTAGATHNVEVRIRGKSRRRVCDFPPLRLDFSGDTADASRFSGQDKLKLVTHCRGRQSAEINVLEEYSAYRIFNILTDSSYKVRLARIVYSDTSEAARDDDVERYGFLIESSDELAERTGAQQAEIEAVALGALDNHQAALVYVFHYLIGNTDWSLVKNDEDDKCCHNGDLFEIDGKLFLVPYDFDLSGLVNARYARPDATLRISKVTQRIYRGYCTTPEALREALGHIKSREDAILGVAGDVPGLSDKNVKTAEKFLAKFFDRAADEDKLIREFERRCL